MRRTIAACLVAVLGAGCGAQSDRAFGHHFLDNQEADLAAIMERLPEASHDDQPENALGQPIAVATTHAEDHAARQMIAWRVDTGEQLWAVSVDPATQPEILGDVVLVSTRERLVAYDLTTGRELWHYVLPDLAYVGATRDGDVIYWAATVGALGGSRRIGHVVAMNARRGTEKWRHEVEGVFGQPAAAGGLVFVPWERQNIAILDELTGNEVARLRSTDDVIAWAFDHPTGIYYGGQGIYRLTHRSVSGVRAESTHIRTGLHDLPRQPESVWPDGFVPRPGTRSARGRIRVYFNPAPAPDAESIHVEGDTYYFAYYRYIFAFGTDGTLRWSRLLAQDVANAEAMPHGLLTFGQQGQVRLLDRDTGNDRWSQDLATEIASVALDAAGFDPQGEVAEARTLRESLNEIVQDPDNRLVPARAYAIGRLAAIEDDEVTRDLLDLYQQRSMPGALREALREALRGRRSGAQYLMEALARRYDFLEETQAPPLEAIVPALLAMEHSAAVPQLINHMMDHETPADVLPQLVHAIVQLGEAEVLPALQRFLTIYSEDSLFAGPVEDQEPEEEGGEVVSADPEARALAMAAAGIFEHGGPEGREYLALLSPDEAPLHDPVSAHIRGLYEAETTAAERQREAEEAEAARILEEERRQIRAALPLRLTQEQVNQTFAENADPIRACIADELARNEALTQVRFVFILSHEGQPSDVQISPRGPEMNECLQGAVGQVQFPRFQERTRRMRAQFTVTIRDQSGDAATENALVTERPDGAGWWWYEEHRAGLRGQMGVPTGVVAWWTEREPPARIEVVTPTEPEVECAPGAAGEACRQRVASGSGDTGTGDTGTGDTGTGDTGTGDTGTGDTGTGDTGTGDTGTGDTGTGDTGTPWWVAAGGDDDEEDDEEEDD